MEKLAQNVTGIIIPNSRHWIPEGQPKFLVEKLTNFFNEKVVIPLYYASVVCLLNE